MILYDGADMPDVAAVNRQIRETGRPFRMKGKGAYAFGLTWGWSAGEFADQYDTNSQLEDYPSGVDEAEERDRIARRLLDF